MNNSRIDTIEIQSKALGKAMAMMVYVPADFTEGLPTLYFMHGRNGDEKIIHALDIQAVADKMIADGRMRPILIACPRMEDALGLNVYEDYFFDEVLPYVEQRYKTRKRYIGGCSAGGYIALNYALRHPTMFERVGGHMPAIDEQLDDEDLHYFGTREQWAANNPLFLAENHPLPTNIEFYLDAGNEDEGGFYRGCAILAESLSRQGIKVQNYLNKGHHTLCYLKEHLEDYLMFYAGQKMKQEINPKDTSRAQAFELWMKAPNPMVTFFKTVDVTRLVRLSKKKEYKFNMLMDWCIGKAASSIKEFYLLPVGDKLIRYDNLAVNTIVKNREGEVSSCDILFAEDIEEFNRQYLEYTSKVAKSCKDRDLSGECMVIGTSAIIDTEIDGAVGMNSGIFNNPFMIWGRYRKRWFRYELPISFQFHHTQMDGAHAGKFLANLQKTIDTI